MIYLQLFLTFLKVGMFAFGGGYVMLSLIGDSVLKYGWMNEEELLNFVGVETVVPGPVAVNMATYVGSEVGGLLGSACATLGVVLPLFVIILIVAKCYDKFRESSVVKGCMTGLKPAVVGLIAGAILTVFISVFFPTGLALSVLQTPAFYISAALFGVMLVLALKKVHPIIIIVISAAVGIAVGYLGLW